MSNLPVRLRPIPGCEANSDLELLQEGLPYSGCEIGATVRDDVLQKAIMSVDLLEECLSNLESSGKTRKSD